jgi:DNA-binding LacI/PurR family transcriptional regulator
MEGKRSEGPRKRSHRVTVRDVAQEIGLHFTTVAEALRGSPRIKEATRQRVQEAADRLGYRPDPVLSALSAYRSSQMRTAFQGTLAWINGFESEDTFKMEKSFYGDCYAGALDRAKRLGYNFEMFWIGQKQMTGKRVSQILKTRNILGVIVGPMPEVTENLSLDWEDFNSVKIGHSLKDSRLTNVISDQFQNTQRVLEKLYQDGFRRIGFACPKRVDVRVGNNFSGGYLSYVYHRLGELPMPMFLDEDPEGDYDAFMGWYRKWKPEVIIAGGRSMYYKFLTSAGVDVPREVQFVALHAEYLRSPVAGISQNGTEVGAAAVDHLVSMIQGFKTGLETFPKTTMVQGRWVGNESYDPGLLTK